MGTVLHLRWRGRRIVLFPVSVPFSMGTVLHHSALPRTPWWALCVSVPFSMGTVLHLEVMPDHVHLFLSFSPLLDGDGVASAKSRPSTQPSARFQSPSRWGRCCIFTTLILCRAANIVSVPFSMGTVLHHMDVLWYEHKFCFVSVPFSMGTVLHLVTSEGNLINQIVFQSPSRWGRCCILLFAGVLFLIVLVSVPFSMGTVLHLRKVLQIDANRGVSVPFSMGTVLHQVQTSNDGGNNKWVSVPFSMGTVLHLSANQLVATARPSEFQSPSRWGRCCIIRWNVGCRSGWLFQSPSRWGRCCIWFHALRTTFLVLVSVPFSMGTVLHHKVREFWLWVSTVSVPFSMGTVLHLNRAVLCAAGSVR